MSEIERQIKKQAHNDSEEAQRKTEIRCPINATQCIRHTDEFRTKWMILFRSNDANSRITMRKKWKVH